MNKFKIKNYGFTLAEVLITLGVVGVVAAMTLPSVIKHHKQLETVNKLKKIYTILNQALKLSEAENGEFVNWDNISNGTDYFEKYWKPYLKVIKICATYSDCGYSSSTPFKNVKGKIFENHVVAPNTRATFILNNGCLVIMYTRSGTESKPNNLIIFDLNGGKAPNTYGKDIFRFNRNEKGIIYPEGYQSSKNTINSNCKSSGEYCAAKIIQDGWKIEKDYPW